MFAAVDTADSYYESRPPVERIDKAATAVCDPRRRAASAAIRPSRTGTRRAWSAAIGLRLPTRGQGARVPLPSKDE
jgi:hypothetical protein